MVGMPPGTPGVQLILFSVGIIVPKTDSVKNNNMNITLFIFFLLLIEVVHFDYGAECNRIILNS
jgi:hypothetical protein